MTLRRMIYVIGACSLFFIGCGDEDSDSSDIEPIDAPFVTDADVVKPSNIEILQAFSMVSDLRDASFLYSNEPDDNSEDDATGECIDKKIGSVAATATATKLVFGAKVDFTECFALEENSGISGAVYSFYFEMNCTEGDDLSVLDGVTFNDENDQDLTCLKGSNLLNLGGSFNFSGDGAPGESYEGTMKFTSFEGQTPTSGCPMSQKGDIVTFDDGCQFADMTVTTSFAIDGEEVATANRPKSSYTHFKTKDVTFTDNETDIWRSSGKVTATINNWDGSVTYTDENPTYKMTSAAGQVQEGTLLPTGSDLTLRERIRAPFSKFKISLVQLYR